MPQEQFDALVNAISRSVLEKLKSEGLPAQGAAPAKPAPSGAASHEEPDEISRFLQQAATVMQATPVFGEHLAAIPPMLDESATGGRGLGRLLLVLTLAVAGALVAEALVRAAPGTLRHRIAAGAAVERGLRSLNQLGLLALLDGLAVLAFWLVARAAIATWFAGAGTQDRFAAGILMAALLWRLYALVFRLILRPGLPAARLCRMDDHEARTLYRRVSAVLLFAIAGRLLFYVVETTKPPPEAIAASRVLTAPIVLAVFGWLVVRSKEAARQWFGGLGVVAPVAGFIGRHWVGLGVSFFTAAVATQVYGAISEHLDVPKALILTLTLVAGLLIFETLMQALVRRLDSQLAGFTPAGDTPKLPDVIARCVRVAVLIGIVVAIAESWVVNVFRLVDASAWKQLARSSQTAGITLFTAFVLWELFNYVANNYVARKTAPGSMASAMSRLGTLMPMLRVTVGIILATVAILIALENIGVNVTPLLAGVSVLGLALSFGSQTLVKDIVSGIFYLADDAFRVGEYIACDKGQGTVESFTLRSVRLRNQNGQVHTIPFGDLGQISNFSRDWAAVKFDLRVARDTDLEKLRQATKKIGAEMMEVPELKAELLEPLKMQGVAEVADNALLIRFKFTARPGNPGMIQNEAVTRMLRTLPALGVEFAK
jgi:small-conductance mechanosensitive channel